MLSTRILRIAAARRLVHTTAVRSAQAPGKDPQLSQGNDGLSTDENLSPGDVQSQSADAGMKAHADSNNPMDPASKTRAASHPDTSKGNPEAIGMQETIGGKSAQGTEGHGGEMGGTEEAQAPGVLSSVKQALGMKTDEGDVKQNQGGGRGVTGTGTARKYHTSARVSAPSSSSSGSSGGARASPDGASEPKDSVAGDQNPHLRHKSDLGKPDRAAEGNAGETPTLPSQRVPMTKSNSSPSGANIKPQNRGFHTSAVSHALNPDLNKSGSPSPSQAVGGEKPGHTAEMYMKDGAEDVEPIDPGKPMAVDSGSSALDNPGENGSSGTSSEAGSGDADYSSINRPSAHNTAGASNANRGFHTSARASAGHSAESYFKDVDDQPTRDSSAPRAVDAESSALDAPGETASGPFHEAGNTDAEYKTTSKDSP
jgi:hypothetical protein